LENQQAGTAVERQRLTVHGQSVVMAILPSRLHGYIKFMVKKPESSGVRARLQRALRG